MNDADIILKTIDLKIFLLEHKLNDGGNVVGCWIDTPAISLKTISMNPRPALVAIKI